MLNLNKHQEWLNPNEVKDPIHIIGVGAIGSTLAENLVRLGFSNLHLWDFDTVSEHNIANQMFFDSDIGRSKTEAVKDQLLAINPSVKLSTHGEWLPTAPPLRGYVFLCVDSIAVRQNIIKTNLHNPTLKAVFDFRMGLTDAQHYAARWTDRRSKENLLKSMDFTDEEAREATPVSACGTALNVVMCVRFIVAAGVSNFIQLIREDRMASMILTDPYHGIFDVMGVR